MGLGVMGKTVMRNLFGKPATVMYPVVKKEFYPTTRGSILYDESTCNYCTLCAKRCPSQAITVDRAEKVWRIDRKRCLTCNFCISVCNKDSLSCVQEYAAPVVKEFDSWLFQAERIAGEKIEGLEGQEGFSDKDA
ncbi:MAG: 4Fe-4S dicluster domain-containing protein [Peptococcaceae bacterium]|nr:4Fe-4S dicluster domain-containing protein [Peptococcaceae bacterium]